MTPGVDELTFIVEKDSDGGYTARALEASIFTESDDLEGLRLMILDAARCRFDEDQFPRKISIHTEFSEQES